MGFADGLALILVHKALQRPPCIQQGHPCVINDIAVRVPWVLHVSRLEGKGGVDEIEIDVAELEFLETRLEGGCDAFRTMIVVPELRGDKHVMPPDLPRLEHLLHRFADLSFGPVTLRSVELTKSCFQRGLGRIFGCDGVGNQRAKTKRGDRTGSVVEGYLCIAKAIRFYHCIALRYFPVGLQLASVADHFQ